ncbi:MAG TPA: HupE/UreJ family protein [Aequorivita sp.]|nr:HupE/UreJ family protein [Aequorivita sp.]
MSDFWLYFNQGLNYVISWKAYNVILFLVVICAAYNFSAWKKLLVLITIFTFSHAISLLLATHNIISVSEKVIVVLIPFTILVAALFNLFIAGKEKKVEKLGVSYIISAFFGLINGLGFAFSFKQLNPSKDLLPLLNFELGVVAAQLIVVIIVLIVAFIFQTIFRFNKRDWVLVVSSIVVGMLVPVLINNWSF